MSRTTAGTLVVADEVADALAERRPVVALESTIISHGMPYPDNVAMATEVEQIVRAHGALPATIAVLNGTFHVGLAEHQIEHLASATDVLKATTRDLPYLASSGRSGATTVASTMYLAHRAGIRVFATGGVGGVHRGASTSFDISADLTQMSTTPVAVVSAGIKSILDIGLTLEFLETHGVPVVVLGADEFPSFYSRTSGLAAPRRLDSVTEVAQLMDAAWNRLGLRCAVSVANPIPPADEIPAAEISSVIDEALAAADRDGIRGQAVTPYLLASIVRRTGGRSLQANLALVRNNAARAAELSTAFATLGR